jgi:hypothetical protein
MWSLEKRERERERKNPLSHYSMHGNAWGTRKRMEQK